MAPAGVARLRSRTLTVFVCLMLALAMALGWLAWQLLKLDREAERGDSRQRLELAADRVAAALVHDLGDLDARAAAIPAGGVAGLDDVVVLRVGNGIISAFPPHRLLFYPAVPTVASPPAGEITRAEATEYRAANPADASREFLALAEGASPAARATALAGAGRTLTKAARPEAALETYRALAQLGPTPVDGVPAELVALEARCQILEALGRRGARVREASAMAAALWEGRYVLGRGAWTFYMEEAGRWGAIVETGGTYGRRQQLRALSDAAAWAYDNCGGRDGKVGVERHALRFADEPVLVSCSGAGSGSFDAAIAGPACVRALAANAARGEPVRVTLLDADRRVAAGSASIGQQAASRTADSLPWTVYVSPARPAPEPALFDGRRRLFVAGFGVVGLVLVAGSYFIVRSIRRESAVAALQTEFVAAVSHEFRTPLTSLRQLSEMLTAGRVATEEQRAKSYEILSRQSERLQRLVESILDFGRLEAGAHRYEFGSMAAAPFVERVVSDFQAVAAPDGFHVKFDGSDCPTRIRADANALALALRNLLDNAVKYSARCRTIEVSLRCHGNRVAIAVSDQGIGIAKEEQRAVFEKFVRGSGAVSAHVTGTGLGLALARRIVGAHRGRIELTSEPGRGSTFTIVLPREKKA